MLSFSSKAKKTKKDTAEKEEPMDVVILNVNVCCILCSKPSNARHATVILVLVKVDPCLIKL